MKTVNFPPTLSITHLENFHNYSQYSTTHPTSNTKPLCFEGHHSLKPMANLTPPSDSVSSKKRKAPSDSATASKKHKKRKADKTTVSETTAHGETPAPAATAAVPAPKSAEDAAAAPAPSKKHKKRRDKPEGATETTSYDAHASSTTAAAVAQNGEASPAPATASSKKHKKRKADKPLHDADTASHDSAPSTTTAAAEEAPAQNGEAPATPATSASKKHKKRKTDKTQPAPAPDTTTTTTADAAPSTPDDDAAAATKARFIVFIGNLPYSTTTEALAAHFAAIRPTAIRHLTQKDGSARSKGYAFLEFDAYDRMKTCLKLYHHSSFGGGEGEKGARRINVELTAGGGGKSEGRRERLQAKNARLGEQRMRSALESRKKEGRKEKKEKKKTKERDGEGEGKGGAAREAVEEVDHGDVHPSRRAQVNSR